MFPNGIPNWLKYLGIIFLVLRLGYALVRSQRAPSYATQPSEQEARAQAMAKTIRPDLPESADSVTRARADSAALVRLDSLIKTVK